MRVLKQIEHEERQAQLCQQQATLENEAKQLQMSLDDVQVAIQNCEGIVISIWIDRAKQSKKIIPVVL